MRYSFEVRGDGSSALSPAPMIRGNMGSPRSPVPLGSPATHYPQGSLGISAGEVEVPIAAEHNRSKQNKAVGTSGIMRTHGWDVLRALDLYKRVLSDIWVDYSSEWDASLFACLIARSVDLRDPIDLLEDLRAIVYGREVYVVGAGPSLLSSKPRFREGDIVFCADGACSILEEKGGVIAISVTDLDGGVEPADRVYNMGGYIVLQMHSDNYRNIAVNTDLIRRWRERILITVQTHPPCSSVTVIPGFTDGDRAYLLALLLGASRIKTVGMDLLSEVSTGFSKKMYSESGYSTLGKLRKLRWAYRIIDSMGQNFY